MVFGLLEKEVAAAFGKGLAFPRETLELKQGTAGKSFMPMHNAGEKMTMDGLFTSLKTEFRKNQNFLVASMRQ